MFILLAFAGNINAAGAMDAGAIFVVLTIAFGTTGWLTWRQVTRVEGRSLAAVGLGRPGGLKRFAGGYAIGLLSASAIVVAIAVAGGYDVRAMLPALASGRDLLWIGALLPAFALQSSVEEFLFRGWLLSTMSRHINMPVAVAASSILFGLLHYSPDVGLAGTVNFVLFGLFTCAWALRSSSIWGTMGWHSAWNWLIGTGFGLPLSGMDSSLPALWAKLEPVGPDWLTGGTLGPEASVFVTLILAVSTVILFADVRRRRTAAAEAA